MDAVNAYCCVSEGSVARLKVGNYDLKAKDLLSSSPSPSREDISLRAFAPRFRRL